MFTGIVEALAVVTDLKKEGGNLHITLRCPFTGELKEHALAALVLIEDVITQATAFP